MMLLAVFRQHANHTIRRGRRSGRAASFSAWASAVGTVSIVAAAGATGGPALSPSAAAVVETLPLDGSREPVPLHGAPLGRETGLRLVVADIPPFVLDVDKGRVMRVPDVPAVRTGALSVIGVGGRAAVVVARTSADAKLYAVSDRGTRVSYLGSGRNVWSAAGGRAVWVQSLVERSRCALREVALDGREIRAARPFPCSTSSDPAGGPLGLVVHRTRVIDPLTGRTALVARWGIWAAAKANVLLYGPGHQFTLLDPVTRAERRLSWPSTLAYSDGPVVDPRGRLVALAFADPAWNGGPHQALDVWLLDTETGELTQLPGMPAFVALKSTSIAWTHDGRLVLLAESAGKDVVAVWRPGRRYLAVKTVHLPDRSDSGSDSFAPIR